MNFKEMLRLIRSDYNSYLNFFEMKHSIKSTFQIVTTHSFTAVHLYRWSRYFYFKKLGLIAKFFYLFNIVLTGADIAPVAQIDEGLLIIHTVGTTINGIIGKNCTIMGQVGLGGDPFQPISRDVGAGPGLAFIGDNVTVGFGAKVLGAVKVGDNVLIGAASLVINSVPDNATVAGVPAKILSFREN